MKLTPTDIEDFYSQYVPFDDAMRIKKPNGDTELTTKCPFHADESPSLSINLTNGLYKCHAASCPQSAGGNVYQFFAAVKDVDVSVARAELFSTYKKSPKKYKNFPHTEEEIQAWHIALLSNTVMMKFLQSKCKYTEQTIEDFELGWNGVSITIPVRHDGQLVNVRQYIPKAKRNKMTGVREFNTACIWPLENTDNSIIYLFEGEKDCILANQLGLPAITVTGGAGTFKTEWRKYFTGKQVIICYDIDKAGIEGAKKVAGILTGSVESIKVIELPITKPENGDFTDYILQKNSIQDFHALVKKTKLIKSTNEAYVEVTDNIESATLDEASYKNNYFKRLRIKVRILGKDLAPFIIPKEIYATCSSGGQNKCVNCGLSRFDNLSTSLILDETRPELLAMLNCTTSQQRVIIRQLFRIAGQCASFNHVCKSFQFVEEVSAIPYIDEEGNIDDSEYMKRQMFVVDYKLRDNSDYEVETLTVPDPRTQQLVHVVYKAKPCETSIEEFKMTDELFEQLKVFQCQPNTSEEDSSVSTTTLQPT